MSLLSGSASFLTEAYGEHKGVLFQIHGNLAEGRNFARVPTQRFTLPPDMTNGERLWQLSGIRMLMISRLTGP